MRRTIAFTAVLGGGFVSLFGVALALAEHVRQEPILQIPGMKLLFPEINTFPAGIGGRLVCERLKKSLLVFDRPTGEMLFGPEWIPGSSRLGAQGNTVVAAHRDTHFRFLKDVKVGDRFELQLTNQTLIYQVRKLTIVAITDTRLLQSDQSNLLTLVTCYPFYYVGQAPKRFIVTASLEKTSFRDTPIAIQASGVNSYAK